jgi:hypothetical protein
MMSPMSILPTNRLDTIQQMDRENMYDNFKQPSAVTNEPSPQSAYYALHISRTTENHQLLDNSHTGDSSMSKKKTYQIEQQMLI